MLFLHGGTPKKQRDAMVERFRPSRHGPRVFLLSLKAGGTGLNLTRARTTCSTSTAGGIRRWRTRRRTARSGSARRKNVQVHKFVCAGTLEEKIDEMIERKKEVAGQVVGTGEAWLTETVERRSCASCSRCGKEARGRVSDAALETDFDDYFPPSTAAQAEGGIRAQSNAGRFGESWWAKRWIAVLESFGLGARLQRGRTLRAPGPGAVDRRRRRARCRHGAGLAAARRTRSRSRCKTLCRRPNGDGGVDALSRQAMFVAKLLAGEMPQDIEEAFQAGGAVAVPGRARRSADGLLVPGLVEPVQAHRGGVLPARRGVRPRSVPDLPAARAWIAESF